MATQQKKEATRRAVCEPTRKRPRHNAIIAHGLPALLPLPALMGVSTFVGPGTRSPREHHVAFLGDDVEEGEIVETEFTRLDGHGRICPVVMVSLDDANAHVRGRVILPPDVDDYLPLSAQCYVYLHIRRMHPQVTDVVLCVGASLMRRILCARSAVSPWLRADRFESLRPLTGVDAQDVARYAVCISLAQKVYGSRDVSFQVSAAIMYLLQRALTPADVTDMECELLGLLDYRI